MTQRSYRFFDHTADFGVEIFGRDAETLFGNAAAALFDLITDVTQLKGRHERVLTISGADWPDLMVNWLRELLYLWNGEEQLVQGVHIESIQPERLHATVVTDDFVPALHAIRNEIKAVTYHQIEVVHSETEWHARVIFDI